MQQNSNISQYSSISQQSKHLALSPKPLNQTQPSHQSQSNNTSFDAFKQSMNNQSQNGSISNLSHHQIQKQQQILNQSQQSQQQLQQSQQRLKIQQMLEQRKKTRNEDLNKSLESPTHLEQKKQLGLDSLLINHSNLQRSEQNSQQDKSIKQGQLESPGSAYGEYTNYQEIKKNLLAQCEEEYMQMEHQNQQHKLASSQMFKQSAMTNNYSNNETISLNISQSPPPQFINSNYNQSQQQIQQTPTIQSNIDSNCVTPQTQTLNKSDLNQNTEHQSIQNTENKAHQSNQSSTLTNKINQIHQLNQSLVNNQHQNQALSDTGSSQSKCVIQPHRFANQTLSLFSPFASYDYTQKLQKFENVYSPVPNREKSIGSGNKRMPSQKIEDRLLEQGKQRQNYLQKLTDFYQSKENENIYEKPIINPQSQILALKQMNSEDFTKPAANLYEREMEFLHNRENFRQKLASIILEEENDKIYQSPRINKASQQLQRNVQNLHDWQVKSQLQIQQQREAKIKLEEEELKELRSASKQSKYNYKYLQNKQYMDFDQELQSPYKVEERLINSGRKTQQKIDQQRKQEDKELQRRMNSPQINNRSRSKKYSQKPFHERLYSPDQRATNNDLQQYNSEMSQMRQPLFSQTQTVSNIGEYNRLNNFNRDLIDPPQVIRSGLDDRGLQHVERFDTIPYQNQYAASLPTQHYQSIDSPTHNYDSNLSPQRTKYTPLRQSRSPNVTSKFRSNSKSKSRNRRLSQTQSTLKSHSKSRQKPDFNYHYKQTYHKNVLLKEWQYLPLYDRQVLWSRQKDKKTQNLKDDQEFKHMKEATFKPQLYERQIDLKQHQNRLNFSHGRRQSESQGYAQIHKNKKPNSPSPLKQMQNFNNNTRDVFTMSPSRNMMGNSQKLFNQQSNKQSNINQKRKSQVHSPPQVNKFMMGRNSTQLSPRQSSIQMHETSSMASPDKNIQQMRSDQLQENQSMQNLKSYQPLRNQYAESKALPQARISLVQQPQASQFNFNQPQISHHNMSEEEHIISMRPVIYTPTLGGSSNLNSHTQSNQAINNDQVISNALQMGDDYYKKMYQFTNNSNTSNNNQQLM
eukprot:403337629